MMIVKASIQWINSVSDAELINNSNVVLEALAENTGPYPAPAPPLATVQTAVDNFSTKLALAWDGGPSATAAKNSAREELSGLLRELASYVTVTCKGDMATLLLSGFPVQKPVRSPIGVLPAPANTTLVLGSRSGELDAGVDPVFGASVYNWQLTSNVPGAAVQTAQSTASYFTFTGLTPGVTYSVKANAVGAAGPGDWSNAATQMAV